MPDFLHPTASIGVLGAAAVLALTGCGSDDRGVPAEQAPADQETKQAPGNSEGTKPGEADGSGKVNPEDYKGSSAQAVTYHFQTEDGQIACTIGETHVGCDSQSLPDSAGEYTDAYGSEAKANAAAMDFGQKAELQNSTNPVYTYFGEDPADNGGRVLAPETAITVGDTTCTATKDVGVTCENGRHGFTVSGTEATTH